MEVKLQLNQNNIITNTFNSRPRNNHRIITTKKVKKIVMPNVLQFVGMLGLLLIGTIFVIPSIQDVF